MIKLFDSSATSIAAYEYIGPQIIQIVGRHRVLMEDYLDKRSNTEQILKVTESKIIGIFNSSYTEMNEQIRQTMAEAGRCIEE